MNSYEIVYTSNNTRIVMLTTKFRLLLEVSHSPPRFLEIS